MIANVVHGVGVIALAASHVVSASPAIQLVIACVADQCVVCGIAGKVRGRLALQHGGVHHRIVRQADAGRRCDGIFSIQLHQGLAFVQHHKFITDQRQRLALGQDVFALRCPHLKEARAFNHQLLNTIGHFTQIHGFRRFFTPCKFDFDGIKTFIRIFTNTFQMLFFGNGVSVITQAAFQNHLTAGAGRSCNFIIAAQYKFFHCSFNLWRQFFNFVLAIKFLLQQILQPIQLCIAQWATVKRVRYTMNVFVGIRNTIDITRQRFTIKFQALLALDGQRA